MIAEDARWIQRFESYCKALGKLGRYVEEASDRDFSRLEKLGTIHNFEVTFEMAVKVIQEFYLFMGNNKIFGAREAFEYGFNNGPVTRGDDLVASVKERNLAAKDFEEEAVDQIFYNILHNYYGAFEELREALAKEKKKREL